MKKIFPLIVVLITLSVVGVILIQMSWIKKAIEVKEEQFRRDVDKSLKDAKEAIQSKFLSKLQNYPVDKASRQFILENNFTTQGFFTKDELYGIIENALRQNKIEQPFEFCILNIFKNPVFNSDGFQPQDIPNSY